MKRYTVKYRLDKILVEVKGVRAESLEAAVQAGKDVCLMKLMKPYRGKTIEHWDGRPRVVGIETSDAWPE